MDIQERIKNIMVEAMKAKDDLRLNTVRAIKSALKYAEIEKIGKLSEADTLGVLKKMVKQRQDSIEQYTKGNRQELADKEQREIDVIQEFLPQMMNEGDLKGLIAATAQETGAANIKDMGRLMKAVLEKAQGRADGKQVSELVKKHLGG